MDGDLLHLPMREVPEEPRRERELAVLAADAAPRSTTNLLVWPQSSAQVKGRPVDLYQFRSTPDASCTGTRVAPDAGAADGAGAVLDGAELQGIGPGTIQYGSPAHAPDRSTRRCRAPAQSTSRLHTRKTPPRRPGRDIV